MKRRKHLSRRASIRKFKKSVNRVHKLNHKRVTRGGFMM